MKKRIISILLAVCLIFGLLPVGVFAANPTSGTCGPNAKWSYDSSTKTLTISGSGTMDDYGHDWAGGNHKARPWAAYQEEIENVIICNGITSIGREAFGSTWGAGGDSNLRSVSIASTVTRIGAQAFAWTKELEAIDLPDGLKSIGELAFEGAGLKAIRIPASVETIEGDASLGPGLFTECENLESIDVDVRNKKFRSVDGVLFEGNTLLRYPAAKAESTYVVLDGTVQIAYEAFENASALTSLSVPASVRKIESFAFSGCTSLQNVTLSEGITKVSSTAFAYGPTLTSLVIPASVTDFTSIGWYGDGKETAHSITFYFIGTAAPKFDDAVCSGRASGYKVIICYPENATGWDAVQQQDDIKRNARWFEFRTGTPPTEPSEPTDELKLVSTFPASDATVTEDDSLVLTFNQELSKNLNWTKGSIYIKNYNTDETALKIDSAKFYALGGTVNGKTLTVPSVFVGLRTGKYYVSVDADVITNASGKTFAGIKKGTLSFAVVFSPYDTNWVWGKDNYRFTNDPFSFGLSYYIKDSDLENFLDKLKNTEIESVADFVARGGSDKEKIKNLYANKLKRWSGSCYGLALTAALFKGDILKPESQGADTVFDIAMNKDVKSFINIYHLSQKVGAARNRSIGLIGNEKDAEDEEEREEIRNIEAVVQSLWNQACLVGKAGASEKPFLVYIGYKKPGSSEGSWGHAVICYGAQEGTFSYTKEIDKLVSKEYSFSKRLLIADPNYLSETYIYIDDDNRFAIASAYPYANRFGYFEATLDDLNSFTFRDSNVTTIIIDVASDDKVKVSTMDGTAIVQKGYILSANGINISEDFLDIEGENGSNSSVYSYILRSNADRVTLSAVDGDKLNADIQIGNYSVSVDGTLDSFTAGKNGTVNIENADDDIQLDLAINDADFDFVSISGNADGDTTLSVTSSAVTVSGEIADMEFTNMNRQTETSTAVVHGDLDAKFTLKNDAVVAAVDKDRDGTFETTLDSDTAQHQFKYVINANDTHTARCTLCDKTITEKHVFVNGVCVCGARKTSGSIDDSSHGSTRPITNNRINFTDVSKTDYFYDAVLWAVENGITTGTSRTRFSPYATCTRAQAVTFLWRSSGSPAPKNGRMPFADVSPSAYYYDAVLWALEEGITIGTSSATFSPDAVIDRAQAVTLLHRANGAPSVTGRTVFTDVPQTTYYADAVKWAVDHEITTGTSAAAFSPNASCTRAQIVTFLYRAYRG